MGQHNLLQEELRQVRHKETLRSVEASHAERLDARGVQPSLEAVEPLAEGWRAYWLGFMAGLGIAVIVPLWTGLREQKVAVERLDDSNRSKRTPAQTQDEPREGNRPGLGRKGNGLR